MKILGLIFHFYQKHFTSPILSSNWASKVALVVKKKTKNKKQKKNPPANAAVVRDAGSILGSGRSPEEGMVTHSSILLDKGVWWATFCRVKRVRHD